jgi:hypothetical protein
VLGVAALSVAPYFEVDVGVIVFEIMIHVKNSFSRCVNRQYVFHSPNNSEHTPMNKLIDAGSG